MIEVVANGRFRIFEEQQPHLSSKKRQPIGFFGFLKHHVGQITKGALALGGLVAFGALSYATRGWWRGKGQAVMGSSSMQATSGIAQPVETGAEDVYFPPRFSVNRLEINQGKSVQLGADVLDTEDMEGFIYSGSMVDTLTIGDSSEIYATVALSGNRLATGQSDNAIYVWNLNTNIRIMKLVGHSGYVSTLAALSGERLASGSYDQTVRIWDLTTGSCTKTLEGHNDTVRALAQLSGERLASGSDDETVRIWDLSAGICVKTLETHGGGIYALTALSNEMLASGSIDKTVRIWDLITDNCTKILEGHNDSVNALVALSDERLASGGLDKTVRIWDLTTGNCTKILEGENSVNALAALSGERLAAAGGGDRNVYIWDLNSGECINYFKRHGGSVINALAALSDERLASGGWDTIVSLWDLTSGNCIQTLVGYEDSVNALVALPGERLASGGSCNTVRIWDLTSGSCIQTLDGHTCGSDNDPIRVLAALSGERLASGGDDNTVRIWDLTNGNLVKTLVGHDSSVIAIAPLSGERLASGSYDTTVRIWDLITGNWTKILDGYSNYINALTALSAERLAFGSVDNSVRIWDLTTGNWTKTLVGHSESVSVLTVLSGERLASGSDDTTVRIWDLTTSNLTKTLEANDYYGGGVRVLAALSGERLVSGRDNNVTSGFTVRIWDLTTGNWMKTLEGDDVGGVSVLAAIFGGRLAVIKDGTIKIWQPVPTPDMEVNLIALDLQHSRFVLENTNVTIFTKQQIKDGKITFYHDGSNEAPSGKIAIKIGSTVFPSVPLNIVFHRTPLSTGAIIAMAVGIPGGLAAIAVATFGAYKWRKVLLAKAQAKKLESELSQRYQGYIIPAKDLEIGAMLGSGSSGTAYLASWKGIDVVVKKIHTGLTANAREDFQKEASMMAQLNHPNIVRLYGVCMEKGQCGMVMEYMPEGSLDKALYDTSRKILWPKRWRMALDISLGVAYLHERIPPIVHRDLKSANIFVDENLLAKVGDFGTAKVKSLGATVATSVGGSPSYMDPESLVALSQGKNVVATPASDIYSLGVLLWEIASRQGPYSGMNLPLVAMVAMVANSGRPEIPKDTPKPYADLITRCWAQRAETRPRIGEVVRYLKANQSNAPKPTASASTTTELATLAQPGIQTMFRRLQSQVEQVGSHVEASAELQNSRFNEVLAHQDASVAYFVAARSNVPVATALPSLPTQPTSSSSESNKNIGATLNQFGVLGSANTVIQPMTNSTTNPLFVSKT